MKKVLILTILFLTSFASISFSQMNILSKDTAFADSSRGKGVFYKPKKRQSPFIAEFGLGSAKTKKNK